MNTVHPDELEGLETHYLAGADLLRAFELALAELVVAERHISWGLVRGRVDPVHVPEIFARGRCQRLQGIDGRLPAGRALLAALPKPLRGSAHSGDDR